MSRRATFSSLAEVREDRVDELKRLVDLLAHFRTRKDDLAGDEDEQHNLWLHHPVDQTGEEFGLVGAEHVMAAGQALETDRELDVAGADDVLDLEVRELGVETQLLDDARVLATRKLAVILGLGACHDHLAGSEDQGRRLGLADTHDHRGKTLRIVLCVACVECDRLEVEAAVEVHRCYDVSKDFMSVIM